jgi:DNA processing protein
MSSALARLRLVRTESVGPITYRRLMERFSSAEEALDALPALAASGGRATPPRIPPLAEVEREYAATKKLGGRFVFLGDPDYPELLAELPDAPPALAVLGDVSLLCARAAGVVGARNASANGLRLAEHLGADLAVQLTVVSGLARGIDTAAHTGALRAGKTIAVVAGGLDVPYPEENTRLQQRIAESGAVVTEAPLGTAPLDRHFPKRNRIIAGLALGLVVVEAAQRSGTLHTVRRALDAGREIFAVPGHPLDPRSAGGNALLRQGAHLTETAADVFANLPAYALPHTKAAGFAEPGAPASPADLAAARAKIPALLGPEPVGVDEIARHCQLSEAAVAAVLLELELAGLAETLPGHRVVRPSGP